ncbi:hypothetical protein JYU34_005032, partial [Plutella xylostella]
MVRGDHILGARAAVDVDAREIAAGAVSGLSGRGTGIRARRGRSPLTQPRYFEKATFSSRSAMASNTKPQFRRYWTW